MLPHQDVVAEVLKQPDGPQIGALFDFDGTVISGYSAFAFIEEQVRRGELSIRKLVELVSVMASFGLGNTGFSAMMIATSQFLRGVREDSYMQFGEEMFTSHIARQIYPETRALIQAHLRKGHTVAIVSSATPYQVEPAARALDIEHVLCTRLEVINGIFTGRVVRPTCFGKGKVTAAETLSGYHDPNQFRLGDLISVIVSHVDTNRRQLEFQLVAKEKASGKRGKRSQRSASQLWNIQRTDCRGPGSFKHRACCHDRESR